MKTNKDIPEYIEPLIVDYLNKEITNKNLALLKSWLNNNDQNKKLFNDFKAIWLISDNKQRISNLELHTKWGSLKDRIENKTNTVFPKKSSYNILPIIRAASIIVFFFATGIATTLLVTKTNVVNNHYTEVVVPMGSRSQVKLPDGSIVWLNAASTLAYNNNFNSKTKREVTLIGEGFFKVKTNPEKPFVVKVNSLDIMAYGTSFNVKAYPEEKEVTTTLVEGEVKIKKKHPLKKDYTIKMLPNQKVVYHIKDQTTKTISSKQANTVNNNKKTNPTTKYTDNNLFISDNNIKTELYTSWKDNHWIIKGEKLDQLAVMLERRYNIQIHINSPEIEEYLFSGTIENETLEQVFQILRLTVPISYSIKKGVVEISTDPTLKKMYNSVY
jgi:ferric-dicitrate binding protein FerR (iron transport regulator)